MTSEELLRYGKEYLHELETYCNCRPNELHVNFVRESIKALEQNPYKDFCKFVAKMVLRDDFEENAGSNAEFLCRRLSKLGIVKADEDEWVLVESEGKKCQENR